MDNCRCWRLEQHVISELTRSNTALDPPTLKDGQGDRTSLSCSLINQHSRYLPLLARLLVNPDIPVAFFACTDSGTAPETVLDGWTRGEDGLDEEEVQGSARVLFWVGLLFLRPLAVGGLGLLLST
jgi:hypothetical protein